ncbi:MAG: sodium:proton antiporter [Proteobacteria bacterium]|nr:sodium:proton antiporter [Pseudomonadota bacterium]
MDVFELLSLLTTLAAVFSWLNYRFLKLPTTIGLMALALVFSLGLVAAGSLGGSERVAALAAAVEAVDFDRTLLHGMLGALLFAGALHVKLDDLYAQRRVVAILATAGILVSTALVAGAAWVVFAAIGAPLPFVYCLVFGALISPTDPIAVLGVLKQVQVPKSLEIKIAGESLFNDGFGVVVFLVLLGVATGQSDVDAGRVASLLAVEVVGGIAYGFALGYLAYRMLHSVDQYAVEILVTLAVVTGGYALAHALHVSGPLAMVVAGLLLGNRGRRLAMSPTTRERLDAFWELADEFLNAILFVLIGLEVLVLTWQASALWAGVAAIPLVLAARWLAVGGAVTVLRRWRSFSPHAVSVLTWGGLRGGISVALALSLPAGPERDTIVGVTYLVVCFSILVQGLSIGPLLARLYSSDSPSRDSSSSETELMQ